MKRAAVLTVSIVAALALGVAALWHFDREKLLVPAMLIAMLFANSSPPPIAEGQITDKDWLQWDEGSRKFTTVLARRFPSGASETTLKSTLLAEGFHFAELPPQENCVPPGKSAPVGVIFYWCLTSDQKKALERTLVYKWGGFPCVKSLHVQWSADDRGAIASIRGGYYGACV